MLLAQQAKEPAIRGSVGSRQEQHPRGVLLSDVDVFMPRVPLEYGLGGEQALDQVGRQALRRSTWARRPPT